jgi:ATP-dependent helicase HrpB
MLEEEGCDMEIQCLYGALSAAEQDAVLMDDSRRIILSTNIAETSLTIPGVRTVIDSGRERVAYYNSGSGLDELRLQDCSQFSADQRAGRAARENTGRCIRMWAKAYQQRRSQSSLPEIQRIDLAPVIMRLKLIHGDDVRTLPWFEMPESERVEQAEQLLHQLKLSDGVFKSLNEAGVYAVGLPVHPRLARMLMFAASQRCVSLAASIAAVCSERDVRKHHKQSGYKADPAASDIYDRLEIIHSSGSYYADGIDKRAVREVLKARTDIIRAWGDEDAGIQLSNPDIHDHIAQLLLSAWPDRVGKRSSATSNNGKICGGIGVRFDGQSALHVPRGAEGSELFVAAAIQGLRRQKGGAQYVRLASEISEADLQAVLGECIRPHYQMRYRDDLDTVQAQVVWRYLDLDIKLQQNAQISAEQISQCLADALAPVAEQVLLENEEFNQYTQRLVFLRQHSDLDIPEINFESLLREICARARSKKEILSARPLHYYIGQLDYQLKQNIDSQAPTHILINGHNKLINYDGDKIPVLAIKIQHCFGIKETPRIAAGGVPLKIHLLAPNNRPAQITDDLASFWENSYELVRKDLKGRYPKHDWPQNPTQQ